ncbi:hypothetical protein JRQ81_007200 [Phrynocephalus forsythii]|uniref:Uncharacterized protein n=1 Tax=Phrynocephalus forsythii TaxID=171643 RepID=A0A9Q1ATX4_9SAUR|nr:hypothetical protein JRQ81_007200 [Phrynocephalus forsythii]
MINVLFGRGPIQQCDQSKLQGTFPSPPEVDVADLVRKMPPPVSSIEEFEEPGNESERKKRFWEKSPCWKKIQSKCPCLRKKKPPPPDDFDYSFAYASPPVDTVSFEDEGGSRHITTFPPSQPPDSLESKPKARIQQKENASSVTPTDAAVPKSVYSVFDAPPPAVAADFQNQEPTKSPKGILKSSEEKMQAGKSVSIHLPLETEDSKAAPALVPQRSTTHFRSQEISPVVTSPVAQPFSDGRASPTGKTYEEEASSPDTSQNKCLPCLCLMYPHKTLPKRIPGKWKKPVFALRQLQNPGRQSHPLLLP